MSTARRPRQWRMICMLIVVGLLFGGVFGFGALQQHLYRQIPGELRQPDADRGDHHRDDDARGSRR